MNQEIPSPAFKFHKEILAHRASTPQSCGGMELVYDKVLLELCENFLKQITEDNSKFLVRVIVHEIRSRADGALRDMVFLEKEGQDDNAMAAAAVGAAMNNLAQTLDAPECDILSRMPMYHTLVKERDEAREALANFMREKNT